MPQERLEVRIGMVGEAAQVLVSLHIDPYLDATASAVATGTYDKSSMLLENLWSEASSDAGPASRRCSHVSMLAPQDFSNNVVLFQGSCGCGKVEGNRVPNPWCNRCRQRQRQDWAGDWR